MYRVPGKSFLLLLLALLCAGCASFEYDVSPADHPEVRVPASGQTHLTLAPLEYRFESVEGRLVMRIYNSTSDSIELLGTKSSVVDPAGESHPFMSQTIAPGSFIKEILPPMRPQYDAPPPSITIGTVFSRNDQPGYIRPEGYGDPREAGSPPRDPKRMDVYEGASDLYWEWNGETDIRVNLVYQRLDGKFQHSFTIHRKHS